MKSYVMAMKSYVMADISCSKLETLGKKSNVDRVNVHPRGSGEALGATCRLGGRYCIIKFCSFNGNPALAALGIGRGIDQ